MANYGYVQKIRPPLTKESFFTHVVLAVHKVLGVDWKVQWADFEHDGPTISVTLPNTVKYCNQYWGKASPREDLGFTVSLEDKHTIAFRHALGPTFELWARGCIEEELSERLKAPLHYDAGPTTYRPGRREYRKGKTVREYVLRNFKGADREKFQEDEFFKRLMRGTPPEFDT